MANPFNKRERSEDARTSSHRECLDVVKRIYDLTGQPDLKEIIDRADASLAGVPMRPMLGLPNKASEAQVA